jgi:hypothetical protein
MLLALAVASGSPTITVNDGTATISAILAGTQGLTVSGGGTTAELILSGSNTFIGGVTINSGQLVLGNVAAFNSGSLNIMSFGAGSTGILDLNGNRIAVAGLTSDTTLGSPVVARLERQLKIMIPPHADRPCLRQQSARLVDLHPLSMTSPITTTCSTRSRRKCARANLSGSTGS